MLCMLGCNCYAQWSCFLRYGSGQSGQTNSIYYNTTLSNVFDNMTIALVVHYCCHKISIITRIEPVGEPYREVCLDN